MPYHDGMNLYSRSLNYRIIHRYSAWITFIIAAMSLIFLLAAARILVGENELTLLIPLALGALAIVMLTCHTKNKQSRRRCRLVLRGVVILGVSVAILTALYTFF